MPRAQAQGAAQGQVPLDISMIPDLNRAPNQNQNLRPPAENANDNIIEVPLRPENARL